MQLHLSCNASLRGCRYFDLHELREQKRRTSRMRSVSLSQLLQKYMCTLVERNQMEKRRLGRFLDITIRRPNHKYGLFLVGTVHCCIIFMCHSEVSRSITLEIEFIEKGKNIVVLPNQPGQTNVANIRGLDI